MSINQNDLSSALCDAYDIKDRLRAYGIKDKPKDADGSETTIGDCIEDIIHFLEQLEEYPPPPSHFRGSGFFLFLFFLGRVGP